MDFVSNNLTHALPHHSTLYSNLHPVARTGISTSLSHLEISQYAYVYVCMIILICTYHISIHRSRIGTRTGTCVKLDGKAELTTPRTGQTGPGHGTNGRGENYRRGGTDPDGAIGALIRRLVDQLPELEDAEGVAIPHDAEELVRRPAPGKGPRCGPSLCNTGGCCPNGYL